MTTYEAITKSGTYAPGYDELLALADSTLAKHEKLLAAWLTECSVPGQAAVLGILMVSTHRVVFVSEQLVAMRYAGVHRDRMHARGQDADHIKWAAAGHPQFKAYGKRDPRNFA